ncbi:Put3p [Sugiyamaella lignohabitans]|uniref:Put3p n=1 Tax=Sugiyamaella lignohabitans TaxID=796027 RepID=A0A161HK36_9ASCO|nr:Put3p [Sugiyamaella lignohabitans]ANB13247.1 Put3p [Sugiyamaella lignohabitans]
MGKKDKPGSLNGDSKGANSNANQSGPRASIACERCRRRHIKCDGETICTNCKKVNAECVYVEGDKKIVISLRFLQKLKRDNEGLRKLIAHYRGLLNASGNAQGSEPILDNSLENDIDMDLNAICEENNVDPNSKFNVNASPDGAISGESSPSSVRSTVPKKNSPDSMYIKAEDSLNYSPAHSTNETSSVGRNTPATTTSTNDTNAPLMVTLPTEHGCVVIPLMDAAGKIDSNAGSFQGTSSMSTFGADLKGLMPRQTEVDLNDVSPSKAQRRPVVARLKRNGLKFNIQIFQDCREHPSEISFELPPYERAVSAHQMFDHYLCGSFYFFNAYEFKKKLHETYNNMTSGTINLPELLWITKLLLVLALGELYFLGSKKGQKEKAANVYNNGQGNGDDMSNSRSGGSSRSDSEAASIKGFAEILFFRKASCLSRILIDEVHSSPSIEGIEVMFLTSFFHQIMDWQVGAYLVNGVALRSTLLLGLHVDAGKDSFTLHELEHRRRIWWSIFHFDRYIAAKAGLPLTIYETSIFAQYPRDIEGTDGVRGEFPKADYINSFIEVTKIVSFTLSELYQRQPDASASVNILPSIYEVMNRLFSWKSKWTAKLGINWNPSGTEFTISRTAANVYHEYLHCVNLTVRPLLYHFVRKRILDRHDHPGPTDLSSYSQSIITLLNASMSASLQTIESLQYLLSVDEFASFGYLDREYCFSSASTLMLFIVAFGVSQICSPTIGKALQLLHYSELAGNSHASIRKKQLLNLTSSFQFLDQTFIMAAEGEIALEKLRNSSNKSESESANTNPPVGGIPSESGQQRQQQPQQGQDQVTQPQQEMQQPQVPTERNQFLRVSNLQNAVNPTNNVEANSGPVPIDLHQLSNISLDEFQAESINFGLDEEKDLWEEITTEASWLGNVSDEFRSLIQDSNIFGSNDNFK